MADKAESFFEDYERKKQERREAAQSRAKLEQIRIGKRVAQARGAVSQSYVIERLDEDHGILMSPRALSQIENGHRALKLAEALALAEIYGVELAAFARDHSTSPEIAGALFAARELENLRDRIDGQIEELRNRVGEDQ